MINILNCLGTHTHVDLTISLWLCAEDGKNDIIDQTETNMVALRRTIYLTIQSSLDFEECAHKLLKMEFKPGQEVSEVASRPLHDMNEKCFSICYWNFGIACW